MMCLGKCFIFQQQYLGLDAEFHFSQNWDGLELGETLQLISALNNPNPHFRNPGLVQERIGFLTDSFNLDSPPQMPP